MIALEIEGPHITLQDLQIGNALLALRSLNAIRPAMSDSVATMLKDAHPREVASTPAGVLQDSMTGKRLDLPISLYF